jgi:tetraacyldisaccharide 4'-kinase
VAAMAQLRDVVAIESGEVRPLQSFRGSTIHAVAGIGHPQAFFDALSAAGLRVHARALADHAVLTRADLTFADDYPVLMTEKDAVKCQAISASAHWAVRMDLKLSVADAARVLSLVHRVMADFSTTTH